MTVTNDTTSAVNNDDTVGAFFRSLQRGQYVVPDGSPYNVQVYLGEVWNETVSGRVPRIFSLRNLVSTDIVSGSSPNNDSWCAVFEDNETDFKVMPADMVRALMAFSETSIELREARKSMWVAKDKEYAMQCDWDLLNGLLNDYADEVSFCRDYERRLDDWNEKFKTAKLRGREADYSVPLQIPDLFEEQVWITVTACSATEAKEKAAKMSTAEVLEKVFSRHDAEYLDVKEISVSIVQEPLVE